MNLHIYIIVFLTKSVEPENVFLRKSLERDESKEEYKLFLLLFCEREWKRMTGEKQWKTFSPFSEDNKSQTFSSFSRRAFCIVHQSVLQSNFDLT